MAVTWEAVVRIAGTLPGSEEATSYGTPALKVRGRLLARLWEDGTTLVLRMSPVNREFVLRAEPKCFHLTRHYQEYPYVLVHLGQIGSRRLAEVLEEGWGLLAPKRLREERAVGRGRKRRPAG